MADAISRVLAIRQGTEILADWRYVGLGMMVGQTYPAAASTSLSYGTSSSTVANAYTGYDRFGRIVETRWKTGSTDQVHSKYGRNATGGIMWRKDVKAASILSPTTQDDHYRYDGLRQVTRHDRGSLTPAGGPPYTGVGNLQQQEDWTYDETGNWKQYQSYAPSLVQTREHNVANQITEIANPAGVVQPVFDPTGNMRTMPAPGDWTKAYTCKWDAWNRLVEIRDGSTLVQANSYDARTRRIRKQTAVETRDYYYDRQWRALEERVSGAIQADYVYSPTDRWNLIRRRRSVSGTLNETRFVLRDYLDPVAILTSAGVVDERYGYEAFGPVRVMDANFATRSSSTCAWNWLYHGEFLDGESGMYDYGYRFYHPALGRWASRDPIQEAGGVNLYEFGGNGGVNKWDLFGLCPAASDVRYTLSQRPGTSAPGTPPNVPLAPATDLEANLGELEAATGGDALSLALVKHYFSGAGGTYDVSSYRSVLDKIRREGGLKSEDVMWNKVWDAYKSFSCPKKEGWYRVKVPGWNSRDLFDFTFAASGHGRLHPALAKGLVYMRFSGEFSVFCRCCRSGGPTKWIKNGAVLRSRATYDYRDSFHDAGDWPPADPTTVEEYHGGTAFHIEGSWTAGRSQVVFSECCK